MQKFLSMLFSRRALAIVGVVMLALLIWFIGPLVAFDTMHPLASVGSRVMAIPRKPSPLPTGRWNYVLHVIVMVPSNHNW
ncbi:hypothetical protein FSI45_019595 [Escherichia coli]|nr:hypothetical protein [Escherichia coli]